MTIYSGKCLCGQISYQVTQLEPRMGHCHCSMCRKFHGAAFATYGEAKAEHFSWLSGVEKLQQYKAHNGTTRQFCGTCGSSLTFAPDNDDGQFIEFSLATLDTDIALKPDAHIFVANKANWNDICDNLPQFKQGRVE
ncbi:GFA family protein [Agarivorans sp. TSD2052]|uniref:GFA family protein n=1 Tax=Agarivorans sp. TSD2052 TaxID=2937286 RepID=UPI00200C60F2|nr:GFA family protein [Agarivorans sp. TSD2052]UPW17654.1 GFA family protein [Agarivorans sp. TSD2052]